ncbi:MAG TPA: ABC transporter ATP-binding protein [bacterium]|nr:ABC transporter ATP-binding protein [bacterium]
MIKIEGLTKKYGEFTAVDSLSLEVEKGSVYGFLGPNGAGKTTTIKVMSGLIKATAGRVCIGKTCIGDDPVSYKRKMALIPDKPYMFEKLRGIEYIRFIANLYDVEPGDYKRRLERFAETFEVAPYINDFIESYSHGMSQKLLITASLIHMPDVFILDEPMVGLDPRSQKTLKEEFASLSKEGMTIFMSTHSLETAESMCTHIGIIDRARLLLSGKKEEVKAAGKDKNLEELFFRLTEGGEA